MRSEAGLGPASKRKHLATFTAEGAATRWRPRISAGPRVRGLLPRSAIPSRPAATLRHTLAPCFVIGAYPARSTGEPSMKVNCAMAVLGCLGAALFGAPAAAQQFSAELVDTGSGNAGHATEVHVSDGKLRIETPGKHRGFMLTDSKAGTSYIVMPEQRMYMDMAAMGGSRMIQVLM